MKKLLLAIIGGTVLLLGLVMMILTGPGVVDRARHRFGLRDWLRAAKRAVTIAACQSSLARSIPRPNID